MTWDVCEVRFGKHHKYIPTGKLESNRPSGVDGRTIKMDLNLLNAELNPTCYLLALLAHHYLHVSKIRVKSLTLRLLMSYIYIAYIYIYIWSAYS